MTEARAAVVPWRHPQRAMAASSNVPWWHPQIRAWLAVELGLRVVRMAPASADASFRRYFRVWREDGATRIVMDAPPDKESTGPFLKVAALLERCGVHVPHIDAHDEARGLMLLEDLGTVHYLSQLRAGADADALYGDAFETLLRIGLNGREAASERGSAQNGRAPTRVRARLGTE